MSQREEQEAMCDAATSLALAKKFRDNAKYASPPAFAKMLLRAAEDLEALIQKEAAEAESKRRLKRRG